MKKKFNAMLQFTFLIFLLTAELKASAQTIPDQSQEIEVASIDQAATVGVNTLPNAEVAEKAKITTKRFTGSFVVNSFAGVKDLKEKGSKATVNTENQIGLSYVYSEKIKLAVGHNFAVRSVGDEEEMADFESDNGPKSGYKTLDPTLHLNHQMSSLLGSKPYALMTRYYVPVSQKSQANQSPGILRIQSFMTWPLNPKFDFSLFSQARLYMNSTGNLDKALGSDSVLRMIVGPSLGYNFSDSLSAYYMPYVDIRSVGYQRGQFNADRANNLNQEIGVYYTLANGGLILNPAWLTSSNKLGAASYEGSGSDENTEYDFNLIAYF